MLCLKKRKVMFCLIKKLFVFHTIIKLDFITPDHLLYYPQMSVLSFHIFFFSYISSEETEHRNNVIGTLHTTGKSSTTK